MKKVISMNYGSNTSRWKLWKRVRFDLIFMMKDIYCQKRIPSTLIAATTSIHLPKSVSTNLTVKSDLKISFLSNPIWSARLVDVICFCSLHVVVLFFQASCGIVSYVSLKFPILIQRVYCLLYASFNAVFPSFVWLPFSNIIYEVMSQHILFT